MSQILAAAADFAMLSGDYEPALRLLGDLERYRRDDAYVPLPGDRRRYFDDNAWIGLALMQLHLQTGDPAHLDRVRHVLGFVATGQVSSGGVRWVEGRRGLHTCSTAPAAQLAVRLHLATRDPEPLAFAEDAMRWIDRAMRLPSGLIADHISGTKLDRTVRSYNQGSTLGASALLSRTTFSGTDLEDALRVAFASLRHFRDDILWRQPPVFNAIWFRNLLALNAVEAVPGALEAVDDYLDRVLSEARDPATGLFTAGGIGSYDGRPAVDQAGIVQLLALRAWPADRLRDVC